MDFQIIDLKTLDYSIAEKLELPADLSKAPVTISVRLHLFYRPGEKLLVEQFRVKFSNGDVEMLRLAVQAAYHIAGLPATDDEVRAFPAVAQATLMTAGVFDGVLSERLCMTPLSTLVMPVPDIERLLGNAEMNQLFPPCILTDLLELYSIPELMYLRGDYKEFYTKWLKLPSRVKHFFRIWKKHS